APTGLGPRAAAALEPARDLATVPADRDLGFLLERGRERLEATRLLPAPHDDQIRRHASRIARSRRPMHPVGSPPADEPRPIVRHSKTRHYTGVPTARRAIWGGGGSLNSDPGHLFGSAHQGTANARRPPLSTPPNPRPSPVTRPTLPKIRLWAPDESKLTSTPGKGGIHGSGISASFAPATKASRSRTSTSTRRSSRPPGRGRRTRASVPLSIRSRTVQEETPPRYWSAPSRSTNRGASGATPATLGAGKAGAAGGRVRGRPGLPRTRRDA